MKKLLAAGFLGALLATAVGLLGQVTQPVVFNMTSQTSTYTAVLNDFVLTPSGTFPVNLPTAVAKTGGCIRVKNTGVGVITLTANGVETIDGAATQSIAIQYMTLTVCSDGANWVIE